MKKIRIVILKVIRTIVASVKVSCLYLHRIMQVKKKNKKKVPLTSWLIL